MNPWSYKAVIADIDGTLVQYRPDLSDLSAADAYISESTIKAVEKLHKSGVKVAAVTGRTYEQSKDLLKKLNITGPCVFAGGAVIRDVSSGNVLFEESIDPIALVKVSDIFFQTLGEGYPITFAPAVKNEGRTNSVWTVANKSAIKELIDKLSVVDGIYYVANEGAGDENQSGLLVLSYNADKGTGTKQLLEILDVLGEDAACVGDGANDVLMFSECNLGIAMGNSEDILKQRADHVVDRIENDGFAEAVEFILAA